MLKFLICIILYGNAPVTDHVHVWAGKHPSSKKAYPCMAIEVHTKF